MYSCHLFLISTASVRSIPFLSFIVPIFAWKFPLVSLILLKRSLDSHSIVFLYLFAFIAEEGFLISLGILWNSAFKWVDLFLSPLPFVSLLFTSVCKASSDHHFPFLHLFSLGMVLIPASSTMWQTSVHRSSGTLSDRSSPLNLFVTFTV